MTEPDSRVLPILKDRYFHTHENSWQDLSNRVGTEVAKAENVNRQHYADLYSQMIFDMHFIPGGRILRNAGRTAGSMMNCYAIPIGDSREQIGQFYKENLILWGEGGGVGTNLSPLRPRGAAIKGVGGRSSGPVSFLVASDGIAETVESGGSRRAAGLAVLHIDHPDVEEFINAKTVDKKLSHYNISVAITEEFITAVERDADWQFKFNQQPFGEKVKARYLWDLIISNMLKFAEPGLLNWNYFTSNNSYFFSPVFSPNPCAEAVLSPYECCDLGSLVLPKFIKGASSTDWKKLEETIAGAVRFLDNVIDVNRYVLKEIEFKAHQSRRIGLGVMGLADYLFAKKLRYGSPKAIEETEKIMKFIRNKTYETLIKLSKEKGSFPKFDPVMYGKAHFVRTLPASLRSDIKKFGVRCVTGLAAAPTGTISLIPETTSGIEPLSYKAYLRKDRVSERMYIHPEFVKVIKNKEPIPDWLVDSSDINPEDHLEQQAIVQKYVDGGVSKTILLPKDFNKKQLSDLLLESIHDVKGVTTYVDGSREGQPINQATRKEVEKYLAENKETDLAAESTLSCSSGTCEL